MSVKLRRPWLWILFPLFVLASCAEKEVYTLPAHLKVKFYNNPEKALSGRLTVSEVSMSLNSVVIQGERDVGTSVYLTRNYDQPKTFTAPAGGYSAEESFDIPHGLYNLLQLSFVFRQDKNETEILDDVMEWLDDLEDDSDDDDDDSETEDDLGEIVQQYLEKLRPGIMIRGTYTDGGRVRHLLMVINDPITYRIAARNTDNSTGVAIDKDQSNLGILNLRPDSWFSSVTPELLNRAYIGTHEGRDYILLTKHINSQIYVAVLNRIEESISFTVSNQK